AAAGSWKTWIGEHGRGYRERRRGEPRRGGVGGARHVLSVLLLVAVSVACQPAGAPPARPAQPAKPAAGTPPAPPAAPGAPTAKPAEAANPAEAAKPAAAVGKPQTGGQLKVGLNADLTTLDPHISGAAVDRQVFYSLFDTLVRLDTDLSIKPG